VPAAFVPATPCSKPARRRLRDARRHAPATLATALQRFRDTRSHTPPVPPLPDIEVVILNDYASTTGGSTGVAIASAVGLAARGVRVTFFSCVGPIAPELRDVPGLEVVCLGQSEIARDPRRLRALYSGLRNNRALAALRHLLAGKDPARTLVHAHTWMKALSPFALHLPARLGFPLVLTLHDFFITCPTGGFFDHATGAICRREPLSVSCLSCNCDRRHFTHKLWRSARTALQNQFLSVPSRVELYLGVSEFSLAILRPHLPSDVPSAVLRNPVDCIRDAPATPADAVGFVYVGRFVREKGVLLFAEAVRATGLPAVFVGDGELAEDLRRLCPEARFTGWLRPAEIRAELRAARALVFTPLWYETLGLVAVEAAAAGLPTIVSDGCAASDVIQHGETGLHFRHGSVDDLARQMRELASNTALTARLGRAAYDWYWSDPWTTDRHVDDLISHYHRVLTTQPTAALA
jgi:glycosyltransferase involved in cell wall biosynthesis